MRVQYRKGFGFGLMSGVITTLGLIVGLDVGTGSKVAVLAGIFSIAIADALSDAMGMHISEEATYKKSVKAVWEATFATFFSKFVFALTFAVPYLIFDMFRAMIVCIVWAFFVITLYTYHIAKNSKTSVLKQITEHVSITAAVIAATYIVGKVVAMLVS